MAKAPPKKTLLILPQEAQNAHDNSKY